MKLSPQRQFTLLTTYLKPYWKQSLLLGILLLASSGFQLFNPQLLKTFIDTAQLQGVTKTLLLLALAFIGSALTTQGLTIADSYTGELLAWNATNQLRSDLVEHCLRLDLSFHTLHPVGDLIERIDGDVDTLSNFFSRLVIQLVGNSLLLLGCLVIFFRLDWRFGTILLLYILLYLLSMSALRKHMVTLWVQQRQASADFYGFLSEWLRGLADLRANGATSALMRRFAQRLQKWFPVVRKAGLLGQRMNVVSFLLISGAMLSLLLVGMYLHTLDPQKITIGTIFALHNYLLLLLGPIWSIQSQIQELQQVEACIQRIDTLLQTRSHLPDTGTARLPAGPLSVELQQVHFGYLAEKPVLHDLSFSLTPGEVLGVLGRTGSGKTTLARLLFRLYDIQHGEISIGEVALPQLALAQLRHRVGLVTQEVQLFHTSLRNNLTFFEQSISDQKILHALEQVGLLSWYQSLPDGLETLIGTEGASLSAGQAQLVAFARVFLHDPGLIILDEASSRLDPLSEALIERALDVLLDKRTAIIIAHRLSTIQRVDTLLILEDGRKVEYGARATLAADPTSHLSALQTTGQEVICL
jgi:ATP-binding cassette subfamily B protein/ATP-binding cassette subfamily C protein